jgi:hypothetical protein
LLEAEAKSPTQIPAAQFHNGLQDALEIIFEPF